MSRQARQKSKTGVYHVMVRGINRQQIFHDDEDCRRFLGILQRVKKDSDSRVLAYCLMVNHVHLLLQEGEEKISQVMKKLGTSYAWYYNSKYQRSGHVFQDRYRSECVEDDQYLLTVMRYIHQNPVKAGMTDRPDRYLWSSCGSYYGSAEVFTDLVESSLILEMFSPDKVKARDSMREFMEASNEDTCLEDKGRTRIKDEVLQAKILQIMNNRPLSELHLMARKERDEILHRIKQIEGTTMRQVAKITGVGLNIVFKA